MQITFDDFEMSHSFAFFFHEPIDKLDFNEL